MSDQENKRELGSFGLGAVEEGLDMQRFLVLGERMRDLFGGAAPAGAVKRAETAFRVYVTMPLTDEDVENVDESFADRRELEVMVGVPNPFSTPVSYVLERFIRVYRELLGQDPIKDGYRLVLSIAEAVVSPDEIVGHAFDLNARVDAARIALPGPNARRRRMANPVAGNEALARLDNASEDSYGSLSSSSSYNGLDMWSSDDEEDDSDAAFLAVGKTKTGSVDVLSFGKMVTHGLKKYEWLLEFRTLDSWKSLDEHVSTSAKFPFSYIGFAQPDKKSLPAKGADVAEGRWIWDGWYSLIVPKNTITYGLNAIWSQGGTLQLKVVLTKTTEEDKTIFSMSFPSHQEVCSPDVRWPDVLDSILKKDLELIVLGLSKHWKVTLKSFTEE